MAGTARGNAEALDLIVSLARGFTCITAPVLSTVKKMFGPCMLNYGSVNLSRK